jgi:P4 family phage/plasmid primase-like protien
MEDDLDGDPHLLAVPNGVVDLRTGKLRAAAPDDMCTRVCKVEYRGVEDGCGYGNTLLDQYLETFIPDKEDQQVLFGILGTLLRGGNPTRMFPIFIGGTTSGKSQLISALEKLLGDYVCTINVSVFRGNLDDKPRPDLVRAMHRRIAYAVEASKIWELHADQVKRITGGDAVPYRDLYAGSVQAVPRFTPLIVTNEMPRIKGADEALRRRMVVFPFDRTLPPALEDAKIKERFINDTGDGGCLQALLARIVEGARYEPLKDGVKWTLLPVKFADATMAGFGSLDNIDEFLEWLNDRGIMQLVDTSGAGRGVVGGGSASGAAAYGDCVRTADLHKWYVHWIKEHGDKQDKAEALNHVTFNSALRTKGWRSVKSGAVRWDGVRLTASPGTWIMP